MMLQETHTTLPLDTILQGDCLTVLKTLPAESVQCCITSPPYFGLRAYLPDGHQDKAKEVGAEETPEQYVARLVLIFREVRRVLRPNGVLWLNLGDSYASSTKGDNRSPERLASVSTLGPKRNGLGGKNTVHRARSFQPREIHPGLPAKNLLGIPWRVAFALQADGWILRSDVIWAKGNAIPESVKDRPTKSHEYLFLFAKCERYFYDAEAIKEEAIYAGKVVSLGSKSFSKGQALGAVPAPSGNGRADTYAVQQGRNKRSVWHINTEPHPEAHFAVMPSRLVEPCILAGSAPYACEICGTPWVRIIERAASNWDERKARGAPIRYGTHGAKATSGLRLGFAVVEHLGWQPGCECEGNTGAGRCVVLDPFSGAGTVALVASQHGRAYLGIELNPAYIALAEQRLLRREAAKPPKPAKPKRQPTPAPIPPAPIPLATRRKRALPDGVEQLALFA